MDRRDFLNGLGLVAACAMTPRLANAGGRHDFVPAQLLPRGQDQAPYPSALRSMMVQLMVRTSIDADTDKAEVRIDSEDFFRNPFVYLAGREAYDDFNDEELRRIRALLDAGGTLFADDASGIANSSFDAWFRRQMERLYPNNKLEPLTSDHTIFRSFYLLDDYKGRVLVNTTLEGVTVDDLSPVIYSVNDVGGAWATDLFGKPLAECVPGGEKQREMAWRFGVNLVMYVLCMNYKKDRVHVEAILERRKLR